MSLLNCDLTVMFLAQLLLQYLCEVCAKLFNDCVSYCSNVSPTLLDHLVKCCVMTAIVLLYYLVVSVETL